MRRILNALRAAVMAPIWYTRAKHFARFGCAAGMACQWVYPYGFVPETGCPVHDWAMQEEWEEFDNMDDFLTSLK